jgi:hypothetical protein
MARTLPLDPPAPSSKAAPKKGAPERIRVDEFRFLEALRLGPYLTTPTLSDCPGRSEARWLCHSRTTPTAVPDGYTPRHWGLIQPTERQVTDSPATQTKSVIERHE